ncbi:MAG: hypothetical protein EOO70_09640, partial [Myxococcaceae bacterium]
MSDAFPIIRLRSSGGLPVARDGVVLCFFIHRNHEEVFSAVWRALQTYLRAVPPRSLNWYGAEVGLQGTPYRGKNLFVISVDEE